MALSPGLGLKYSPLILAFKSANRGRILHSMQEAHCLQGMQPKRRDCLLPERVGGAAGKRMVVSGCLDVQLERTGNLARERIHVCVCICPHLLSCVQQALLSMGFPRQQYWSGFPFPPPEYLLDPGIEPLSLVSPALVGRFFTTVPPGKQERYIRQKQYSSVITTQVKSQHREDMVLSYKCPLIPSK